MESERAGSSTDGSDVLQREDPPFGITSLRYYWNERKQSDAENGIVHTDSISD